MELKVTEGINQDYLVKIYEKKFKKYRLRFSAKNQTFHKAILWRKKRAETTTASDVEILA